MLIMTQTTGRFGVDSVQMPDSPPLPHPLSCNRSYLEEGEVAVPIDAGDLQVAHDNLTVLVELLQGVVLLVHVGEGAQLVFRARTNCSRERERRQKQELGSLQRRFVA